MAPSGCTLLWNGIVSAVRRWWKWPLVHGCLMSELQQLLQRRGDIVNLLTMRLAQNDKCPVLLPQSCEVCRGGLLAPRASTDHLPIPSTPVPCGTAYGGVNRWANGHEQQRHHPLRGLGTTSHQAPSRHQHCAVQKASLPHELQEARTSENEFMTLGFPADIRTHQVPAFSISNLFII